MKIVILDGHTLNPGDLSWKAFEELGEVVVYERSSPEEVIERARDCDALITNKAIVSAMSRAMDRTRWPKWCSRTF